MKRDNEKRQWVTTGRHIHQEILPGSQNMEDDPIFSVNGHLIFNYEYYNNGVRILPSGTYLSSPLDVDKDNTVGLGNDFFKTHYNEIVCNTVGHDCKMEVAPHQDCPLNLHSMKPSCGTRKVLGTDATGNDGYCKFEKVPSYGSYAILVDDNWGHFPSLESINSLESAPIILSSTLLTNTTVW